MNPHLGHHNRHPVSSLILCTLIITVCSTWIWTAAADEPKKFIPIKTLGFKDPNTGYAYRITSYNATSLQYQNPHQWSVIKVARVRLDDANQVPASDFEHIQTIKFHPSLVDFDLNCLPTHCYLVAVTSASKRNIELYAWHRTQLDLLVKRDSFARPNAVKLFSVGTSFYIAIAQEQLHLKPSWVSSQMNDYEEHARFLGCAILKFLKGQEKNIKYHQFIKLPYTPLSVGHFISFNPVSNHTLTTRSTENHFVVFSADSHWHETSSIRVHTFIWSALDDHFWPFRLPRGIVIDKTINKPHVIRFPSQQFSPPLQASNQATTQHHDVIEPVESCFNQLQRIITDRELYARKLIDSSGSIWRSPRYNGDGLLQHKQPGLSNISAQVIVHGNVIVRGQIIESPQVSLIGAKPTVTWNQIASVVNAHSPAIVDNKLKQAFFKLNHIRNKLARAVPFNSFPSVLNQVDSRVRFFGTIHADRVEFINGISNSNVKLNGIPFRQLEHELVGLRGVQDIAAKVVFKGNVVADLLEIHSLINGHYFIKNAVDILSRQVQVINSVSTAIGPGRIGLDFYSVTANDLVLSPEAKFNHVMLRDFITRDNRTQLVFGRKFFSRLSMGQLDMGNPNAKLNGFNINKLASESIRLRTTGRFRQFMFGQQTFLNNVIANRLVINHLVNGRINVTSLIHDTVKTFDAGPQLISGHKHFMQGLKINHLTTQGSLNGIQIDQVFNLNLEPPVPDYFKYSNISSLRQNMDVAHPITGSFVFKRPITILGSLITDTINGVDMTRRAIRRFPANSQQADVPQIVYGRKQFIRPLHVVNKLHMISPQHKAMYSNNSSRQPPSLINGFDLSNIKTRLNKLISSPQLITIQNLLIDGNLNLPTSWNRKVAPKTTFGSFADCPLDLIQRKLILSGSVDQQLDIPMRISSLRVRSAKLGNGALNGMSFPQDFVLKSPINGQLEPVYGHKTFDHLEVNTIPLPPISPLQAVSTRPSIIFDKAATINNVSFVELQTFINSESKRNFTGEIVYQTINLFGNIRARRINGYRWPDDILLKSIGAVPGPIPSPYLHKRIYSHLIFLNTSHLTIDNQLVLRGPIQLNGYLNGINITDFSRNAATYGDKDLLAAGRPIRNKIFAGGLTVNNEIRSRGSIDHINFDEMRRRVVTIGPSFLHQTVTGQKIFMSDLHFKGPVNVNFLGDLPLTQHLERIQFRADNRIHITGKKTITGTLKINGDLIVQGLINGIDFVDLKAKSISIASPNDNLKFNKTLIVDGDVFMDNLLIDERNGEIDGVRLASLIPIDTRRKNELVISNPHVKRSNTTFDPSLMLEGAVNDCQITCTLVQAPPYNQHYYQQPPIFPMNQRPQTAIKQRSNTPERLVSYNGRNITSMRTTAPYSTYFTPSPQQPIILRQAIAQRDSYIIWPNQKRILRNLARRQPTAIHYEGIIPVQHQVHKVDSQTVVEHLDALKNQLISLNLVKSKNRLNLIVGFVDAYSQDVSKLKLSEDLSIHNGHTITMGSFLILDEIDYLFRPTTYHMSIGFFTNRPNNKEAVVFATVGPSPAKKLSDLPIESPNNAMFLPDSTGSLFLLVSQDFTTRSSLRNQCPLYPEAQSTGVNKWNSPYVDLGSNYFLKGGVHVYLFHTLTNSSLYDNAYFDLYQTIDLPAIDSFANFRYKGSTYALAISRPNSQVYLLILRGYSGFQVVSHFHAPMIEEVKVFYTLNNEPVLQIYQKNGQRLLMDPVIV